MTLRLGIRRLLNQHSRRREDRPRILAILNSPVAVALISVIGGGVGGAVITHRFQTKTQASAFAQEMLKAWISAKSEHLKVLQQQRREVMEQAISLTAKMVADCQSLAMISTDSFQTNRTDANVAKQMLQVRTEYNQRVLDWNVGQKTLQSSLLLYFPESRNALLSSWTNLVTAVDDLSKFARSAETTPDHESTAGSNRTRDGVTSRLNQVDRMLWKFNVDLATTTSSTWTVDDMGKEYDRAVTAMAGRD